MGSQQNSIREKLTSSSAIATWLVAPAIVAGIALLGFQTYSLITGKSFSDFDFGIGKLWTTEDALPASTSDDSSPSIFARALRRELAIDQEETLEVIDKTIVPRIQKKNAPFVQGSATNEIVRSEKVAELFSAETIIAPSISANFGNKQIEKYVNRLQNEYLINPGLVPKRGTWYVGLSFTPSICYRSFGYNSSAVPGVATEGNTQYTFGLTEQHRDITDKAITSYAVGLDFGRHISDRLSIFSGLHYAKYGEQISVQVANRENPNYEMSSYMGKQPHYERATSENRETLPYANKYSFLEIPLGVSYVLKEYSQSKIAINTAVVLQKLDHVNALVYDFHTDYYYWMNSKEDIFREYGVGGSVGVTFSQYVGERFEVYASPQFKYNLNSTFKTPYPITQNQYTTGLQVGFRQQLF